MSNIQFKLNDNIDLGKKLEIASKKFPATAEKVLKKEARVIAKDLKSRVKQEAKGEGSDKTAKPLSERFSPGKVIQSGKKITVSVMSTAPHYHLYEEGHEMYTHDLEHVGTVKGRKTVAKYMSIRSEYANIIGENLLDEILKEAGIDSD